MTRPNRAPTPIFLVMKRAMDMALSGLALALLWPLMALIGLAIKIESPGPALFRQERLGKDGQPFTMLKFRSMRVGAEAGGVYVTKTDSRVTRVGAFIRKLSLDELPQLLNVWRGEMSIIGPRPTLTYHPWPLEEYSSEQKRRFEVRPGLSGWAQVNGRKTVEWTKRLEYDVEYVDRMSFTFDTRIILLTIFQVVSGRDNENTTSTATRSDDHHRPTSNGDES